jgi:hypothetical protein
MQRQPQYRVLYDPVVKIKRIEAPGNVIAPAGQFPVAPWCRSEREPA